MADKNRTPEVGDGVTQMLGSDRYPYTVIEVSKSGKQVTVQADRATQTAGGMSDSGQRYTYEANPQGKTVRLSKRNDGYWRIVGDTKEWWNTWGMGGRERYVDYSK